METLEILALILSLAVLIKLFVILVMGPQKWLKIAEKMVKQTNLMTGIYFVLAAVVGYFVFTNMTIVQVLAASLFIALVIALGFLPHFNEILAMYKKDFTKGAAFRREWLYILIWLVLAIWGLIAAFT